MQFGFIDYRVKSVIVIDIPVAKGKTIRSFINGIPQIFFIQFSVIAFVILTIKLDPIALG